MTRHRQHNDDEAAPACLKCGCRHYLPAGARERPDGTIARTLECRHCGARKTVKATAQPEGR